MAIISEGELLDYSISSPGSESIVGNIYKGLVTNIFAGTQSCFINIGHERNAVLYAGDIAPATGSRVKRPIETILKAGQQVVVQALRDGAGDKGAHVTTILSLPGKYAVLLPDAAQYFVSRRIADARETERLRSIAQKYAPAGCGLIMRTEAAGVEEELIAGDVASLEKRHQEMRRNESGRKSPDCIHTETDFYREILFRALEADIDRVIVDERASYRELLNRASVHNPDISYKIRQYLEPWPIFSFYGIQNEVNSLQSRRIWLKCGAYIVVDHTEAMTVIDVNTGKFNGAVNQGETFLRVNKEAVVESARQMRLRNIGGIVVIDALRMDDQAGRRAVIDSLESELLKDRQKTTVAGYTRLGLIELTRKKSKAGIQADDDD
jgi:ribonuclease G